MARQRLQAKKLSQQHQRQAREGFVGDNDANSVAAADVATAPQERMKTSSGDVSPAGAGTEWLMMLVLVAYACYLISMYQADRVPTPLSPEQAGIRGFSEEAAREHVVALTGFGPHPVGSHSLERALKYVYSELMEIKDTADDYVEVEVELFEPSPGLMRLSGGLFYGKSLVFMNHKHLVVRVSPTDFPESRDNAILVSSHVDTVFSSPGAGDCSSCISVMLELVRALSHWANRFKHSVIFLFNTGEEEGLVGAHSFITKHPWSATIRAVIDVEAMGTGGRSVLFQAGPDKWLLKLYASVATYPNAQILAQDVFNVGLVKVATDFQVYREAGGLSGLDFAFIENGGVYHTKNDKIEYLRSGSLQQIGDDLLALLKAAALSDELEFVRTNSSTSEKMEMVYFDILGNWLINYPLASAKNIQMSIVSQGVVLFFGSLYLSGYTAFIEFGLAILALAFTWIFAVAYVLLVATILPYLSAFPIPYIAHPWLVVGLFGAPAVFGALLGHSFGRAILMYYLTKNGHMEEHVQWHSERWLFKAGIFQWIVILGLGTWIDAGSSYIAVFWVLPPALAYGMLEAQFSPQQTLRGLQRATLWLSMVLGAGISAFPVVQLSSVLIGNLVRFDRNPGGVPVWTGNALIGVLITIYTCLMLVYMFPYAHRSGGLVWILLGLTAFFLGTLLVVMTQIVPAFTENLGRGIQAVHVIDTTGSDQIDGDPLHYISLASVTSGKLEKEMAILKDGNFVCGETSIDFVSYNVKYGCKKLLQEDEALSRGQPALQIEQDRFADGQRITDVKFDSGSGRRWNLAINTTAVQAFKLDSVSEKEGEATILVPGGAIVGVDGWHNVQFTTDAKGPSKFLLTLFWHRSLKEEAFLTGDSEILLLKLRTDVNVVTDELGKVLKKLPNWCVIFGKSTAPYTLGYLADLTAPLPS